MIASALIAGTLLRLQAKLRKTVALSSTAFWLSSCSSATLTVTKNEPQREKQGTPDGGVSGRFFWRAPTQASCRYLCCLYRPGIARRRSAVIAVALIDRVAIGAALPGFCFRRSRASPLVAHLRRQHRGLEACRRPAGPETNPTRTVAHKTLSRPDGRACSPCDGEGAAKARRSRRRDFLSLVERSVCRRVRSRGRRSRCRPTRPARELERRTPIAARADAGLDACGRRVLGLWFGQWRSCGSPYRPALLSNRRSSRPMWRRQAFEADASGRNPQPRGFADRADLQTQGQAAIGMQRRRRIMAGGDKSPAQFQYRRLGGDADAGGAGGVAAD